MPTMQPMQLSTDLANQLEDYLNLSSAQLKVTAGNMANLDTPGYKTKGFDFPSAMREAIAERDARSLAAASGLNAGPGAGLGAGPGAGLGAGLPAFGPTSDAPALEDVDQLIARPDGNNVSLDREGLQMADAQLKFRIGVELLKREYAGVSEAIHSDAK